MRRHKIGYKFTDKSQSKRGICSFILAALSILIFIVVIVLSFQSRGNGTMYLGSAGVFSMLLALVAFVLAVKSLGEENSYKFFPIQQPYFLFWGLVSGWHSTLPDFYCN